MWLSYQQWFHGSINCPYPVPWKEESWTSIPGIKSLSGHLGLGVWREGRSGLYFGEMCTDSFSPCCDQIPGKKQHGGRGRCLSGCEQIQSITVQQAWQHSGCEQITVQQVWQQSGCEQITVQQAWQQVWQQAWQQAWQQGHCAG